jgi:hypothetical protein
MWDFEVGSPDAKIIMQQNVDIDSASFPSLESSATKI